LNYFYFNPFYTPASPDSLDSPDLNFQAWRFVLKKFSDWRYSFTRRSFQKADYAFFNLDFSSLRLDAGIAETKGI
jgi:hypothetical protein